MSRGRRLVAPGATAAAVLAGAAVVRWRNPSAEGAFLRCPFKAITGLDCPGCGGLRSTHALLRGDVVAAVDHNLLLVPVALLALWLWIVWTAEAATGHRLPTIRVTPLISVALVVIVAVFTVARNLPGVPFLPA